MADLPPDPTSHELPAAVVRDWLQLRPGQVRHVPLLDPHDSPSLVLVGPLGALLLVELMAANSGVSTGGMVWLAAPFAAIALLAVLSLRRLSIGLAFDEVGLRDGALLRMRRRLSWSELTAIEERRLWFGARAIELPQSESAELALRAARRILDARRRGWVVSADEVPATALSRLTLAQEEAPSTALSLAPGDADDAP